MSLSVKTALSVYGKYAAQATGKAVDDLTVEDFVRGIVVGREELNRGVAADIVDRVLCYRSTYDLNDVQLDYCRGDAAVDAARRSPYAEDVRLIYRDGHVTGDIPGYLRDALSRALTSSPPTTEASGPRSSVPSRGKARRTTSPAPVRAIAGGGALALHWMLMPFRRYADFRGRSRRMEYWMWMLFQAFLGFAFFVLISTFDLAASAHDLQALADRFALVSSMLLASIWLTFVPVVGLLLDLEFGAGGEAFWGGEVPSAGELIIRIVVALYAVAAIVPHLAVSVRRLHDSDRSGWWFSAPLLFSSALGLLFQAIGVGSEPGSTLGNILLAVARLGLFGLSIALLIFLILKGTEGRNDYGEEP